MFGFKRRSRGGLGYTLTVIYMWGQVARVAIRALTGRQPPS